MIRSLIVESQEKMMIATAMHAESERLEFLKWVSERNAHIPRSLLEFLIDTTPGLAEGAEHDCLMQ